MTIGNQTVTKEDMPSYVSPQQQPYHIYQSMQDIYTAKKLIQMQMLGLQQQSLNVGNQEQTNSTWR